MSHRPGTLSPRGRCWPAQFRAHCGGSADASSHYGGVFGSICSHLTPQQFHPPQKHICVSPPPDRRPGVHGSTGHNSPQWGAARTPHGGAADGPCVVYSRSGATGKDTGEPLGCWKVPFCTCVLQTKLCLPTNPYIDALTPDGIFGDEPLGAHRFWGHKAVGSP